MDTDRSLWAAFLEWRRRCSIAACSPSAARLLRDFAAGRFDAFCRRYAAFSSPRAPHPLTPPAADCWHLFETRFAVNATRSGKRYKQWLFAVARAGGAASLQRLTGGASLLMRDVVRGWLLHEAPRPRTVSLQAPIGPGAAGEALPLEALLATDADPADEAADRDLDRVAAREADRHWPGERTRPLPHISGARHPA